MEKFKVEFEVSKKCIEVEANSDDEARKIAIKTFIKNIKESDIDIIYSSNLSEINKTSNECREEVIDYIDDNVEGLAESYGFRCSDLALDHHKETVAYYIDCDFDNNKPPKEVKDFIKKSKFKFSKEEYKYLHLTFKKEALNYMFD